MTGIEGNIMLPGMNQDITSIMLATKGIDTGFLMK